MTGELVADECVQDAKVRALRADGYDVWYVKEHQQGINDDDILATANAQRRLLLTEDKDFGDKVFRDRLPAPYGIVLSRLPNTLTDAEKAQIIRQAFASHYAQFAGMFAVIDERQVRIVALPAPQP
ncbi:MAG TPA: DUF5615 family PIN-like protein [Ktedonobacterales bacterium]|nr:DUF5615 family PIN-like protein [Ktedonobacterales bacterium]